jgi:FKBP-type peptidyl-prolyl cis-trans isomerase
MSQPSNHIHMKLIMLCGGVTAILFLGSCKSEFSFTGTTPTGYSYISHIDKPGDSPQIGDRVWFSRTIRLGQDSTLSPMGEQRIVLPEKVQLPDPLPADFEMLLIMSPGDSASVYVFGERLAAIPNVSRGPKDTIIYDIMLKEIIETKAERSLTVNKEEEVAERVTQAAQAFTKGLLNNVITTTPSGLQYVKNTEGTGRQPKKGDQVEVNYYGALLDGVSFDNSYKRGEPFVFSLGKGQVIAGWDEGVAMLKEGGSATLFLPSNLGYGERGAPPRIPANATLVFFVELNKIID